MSWVRKVPFNCGIHETIFKTLKKAVKQLKPRDCVLMFDEIALQPFLTYNKANKFIDGFEEISDGRSRKIADSAILFMAKGIAPKWKHSIA